MHVLAADDDPVSLRCLEGLLANWGYDPIAVGDGAEALARLESEHPPRLVVLDWMMPGLDGPDVCRRLRAAAGGERFYVLVLTNRQSEADVVEALDAGADDHVGKPFEPEELRARLRVGARIIELQSRLADEVDKLQEALSEVRQLRELLPICAYCKKVREGEAYARSLEAYLAEHMSASFSHGVCPDCYERHVRPQLAQLDDGD